MSNSALSVTNLPECLNELLNIPLQKSSRKTQQGELQTLAQYHFTWRFFRLCQRVRTLILEPAVARLWSLQPLHLTTVRSESLSARWNRLKTIKKVWSKTYITSSYLLMSTFLLFLILNLLQRIQSSHKTCIKAEVIRCEGSRESKLKRGGRGWKGRKPHSVTSYNCYLFV